MISACVLICCEPRKHPRVAERAREVKGVVRAFSATGRWDVIVEVEAADLRGLTRAALELNGMHGVRTTETLVEATV